MDLVLVGICQMMSSSWLSPLVLYGVRRTVLSEGIMTSHHPRFFDNVLRVDVLCGMM
jgi:hypothetical protein